MKKPRIAGSGPIGEVAVEILKSFGEIVIAKANSEEALLWHGWGLYRQGNTAQAAVHFREALEAHPGYQDANYALNYVQENP